MLSVLYVFLLYILSLLNGLRVPQGDPVVELRGENGAQPVTFLSWDTEGGDRAAATTFLPTDWVGYNEMQLPGIISSPDFEQMMLSSEGHEGVRAKLLGNRVGEHTIMLQLKWSTGSNGKSDMVFRLEPVWLGMPKGFDDDDLWRAIRRGWFNMLQPSSQWGQAGHSQSALPGLLAWWISKDGEIHDLSAPMITSIAIMYGLVEPVEGRPMLNKIWEKIETVGFERFDSGVPVILEPVRKGDYSQAKPGQSAGKYGRPFKEDGSDTFQQYLNGGCCVSDAYYFLTALYMLEMKDQADRILSAMLKRQVGGAFENGGGFQNGVVDEYPYGAEFYDWNGHTTGYEGHLIYSFSFLQAVFYRNDSLRQKALHPLWE